MNDLALLLGAIAALVGALFTGLASVVTAFRSSERERPRAARGAVGRLAEAAEDGEITADELADVLKELRKDREQEEDR